MNRYILAGVFAVAALALWGLSNMLPSAPSCSGHENLLNRLLNDEPARYRLDSVTAVTTTARSENAVSCVATLHYTLTIDADLAGYPKGMFGVAGEGRTEQWQYQVVYSDDRKNVTIKLTARN